jgi:hypothetical protein
MILRSLTPAHARRWQSMLDHYRRDELQVRVTNVFKLDGQADQVTFEPIDLAGQLLRDRAGRCRRHTFQAAAPLTRLAPAQTVSVTRDGTSVRLWVMPLGAGAES